MSVQVLSKILDIKDKNILLGCVNLNNYDGTQIKHLGQINLQCTIDGEKDRMCFEIAEAKWDLL